MLKVFADTSVRSIADRYGYFPATFRVVLASSRGIEGIWARVTFASAEGYSCSARAKIGSVLVGIEEIGFLGERLLRALEGLDEADGTDTNVSGVRMAEPYVLRGGQTHLFDLYVRKESNPRVSPRIILRIIICRRFRALPRSGKNMWNSFSDEMWCSADELRSFAHDLCEGASRIIREREERGGHWPP